MAKNKRSKKPRSFQFTKPTSIGLQAGKIVADVPDAPLGAAVGTVLGQERKPGMQVHYEKADCPCGGENERCARCDGSGYYTKEVVDQLIGDTRTYVPSGAKHSASSTTQETSFSNDQRGGVYGIRERGKYGSNPLHDDHE